MPFGDLTASYKPQINHKSATRLSHSGKQGMILESTLQSTQHLGKGAKQWT
jgi:hypothetical protein